jgi:hypothetical protein
LQQELPQLLSSGKTERLQMICARHYFPLTLADRVSSITTYLVSVISLHISDVIRPWHSLLFSEESFKLLLLPLLRKPYTSSCIKGCSRHCTKAKT